MKALVTGASGFIGSHLVEQLVADGLQVRCLVRDPSRIRWLSGLMRARDAAAIELVTGDCTRPETLASAVAGVDRVYHVAGVSWARDSESFFRHNALGTENLLAACLTHAPELEKFIYISSLAATGPARSGPVLESDPLRPLGPYGASKVAAEYHVRRASHLLPTVILRPAAVYGPRDSGFVQYFRLVKRGFLVEFGAVRRRVSMCHVADVVHAIVAAGNSQVGSGTVYFIADPDPYNWGEVESIVSQVLGVSAWRLRVPQWILHSAGGMAQRYSQVTGRPVKLSAARAAELAEPNWVCNVTRVQHELGFAPTTSLEKGLREAVLWYQQQKWL